MSAGLPFALIAVSDRRSLGMPLGTWLQVLGKAQVGAVQLREKDLADRARWALARNARRLLPETRLLINGRVDIARAVAADGVHLPAAEIPVAAARRVAGADSGMLVGRSAHTLDEVEKAASEGADYVVFGPVFPTASKPGASAVGLQALAQACSLGVPVLALGGVGEGELAAVARAGARGMAGIRAFQEPTRLEALVCRSRGVFGSS
jgi:thiamine-phosphate pyrophosphorylase